MKLRQIPGDFVVQEIPDFQPDPAGRFFVYEITKRSTATLDVLEILRKALRATSREVSASGLKDKHAVATQLVSLPRPLPASFSHPSFDWKFAGKSAGRLTADNIAGNRFRITARALTEADLAGLDANVDGLLRFGVPNWYDSQRFGGGGPEELPGRALVRGRWEQALRMHIAVPRRKQSMRDKRVRRLAQEHWGDWATLAAKLPKCREAAPVIYLAALPGDWLGALERCDQKVLQLYAAAFQSHLFNQSLRHVVRESVPAGDLAELSSKGGGLLFWKTLSADSLALLESLKLALPAAATPMEELTPTARAALDAALASEQIALGDVQVRGLRHVRLRDAMRRALVRPGEFELDGPHPDDLNPGRQKLTVSFTLGKGSFATVVLKRLGVRTVSGS